MAKKILISLCYPLSILFFCSYSSSFAEDGYVCVSGDLQACAYESDSLSIYIKGRDAYDKGREVGDLSQAREIAYQLLARNNNKNGRVLLKMIYMEIRMGGHKNNLQAYAWVKEAIGRGESYSRLDFDTVLNSIRKRMTENELTAIKKL